jgi:L-threonylcarbamoyladenylate synthase
MKSKYINFKQNKNYEELKAPAEAIREGKLVIFPTETVYGIGANAIDEEAVRNIYIAKGRASDNPLIAHISDIKMLDDLVLEVGEIERKLIKNFWPGPLTIVFNKKPIVPDIITGGLDTVAVRMPSNEIAHKLIEYSNCPIAAPSANISGKPSGTQIEDIIEELDGKVEYIIDNGKVDIGVESTVIRVVDNVVHILRPGKITPEDIEELGIPVYIEKQILR